MTDKMIVSDPDIVETKKTDKNGRLYLGSGYEDVYVRFVVKKLDEEPVTDGGEDSDN